MSGVTAEQDNKITDYRTTSYGKERRQSVEGAMDYRTTRLLTTDNTQGKERRAEGKALPECVLR